MTDSFLWQVATDRVRGYAVSTLTRLGKRGNELDELVADAISHAYAIIRSRVARGPCPIGETVQAAARHGVQRALRGCAAVGEDWAPRIGRGNRGAVPLPTTIAAATARPDQIDAARLTPGSAIIWTLLSRGEEPADVRRAIGVSAPTFSRRLEQLREELLYQL